MAAICLGLNVLSLAPHHTKKQNSSSIKPLYVQFNWTTFLKLKPFGYKKKHLEVTLTLFLLFHSGSNKWNGRAMIK